MGEYTHGVMSLSTAGLDLLHGHHFACSYMNSFWSYKAFLPKANHVVQICFSNALVFNYDITEP